MGHDGRALAAARPRRRAAAGGRRRCPVLTVLSVAYPLAPVGPDAIGGAEQILTALDHALVRAGHRSLVVACAGSRVAGGLVAVPRRRRARRAGHRRGAGRHARGSSRGAWPLVRRPRPHARGRLCRLPAAAGRSCAGDAALPPEWYARAPRPRPAPTPGSTPSPRTRTPGSAPIRRCCLRSRTACPEALALARRKRGFALMLAPIAPEKGVHVAVAAALRAGCRWWSAASSSLTPSTSAISLRRCARAWIARVATWGRSGCPQTRPAARGGAGAWWSPPSSRRPVRSWRARRSPPAPPSSRSGVARSSTRSSTAVRGSSSTPRRNWSRPCARPATSTRPLPPRSGALLRDADGGRYSEVYASPGGAPRRTQAQGLALSSALATTTIRDTAALARLEPASWDLLGRSPAAATPFQSRRGCCRGGRRSIPARCARSRCMPASGSSRSPLYVERTGDCRHLLLLGISVSDYHDVLADESFMQVALAAIARHVAGLDDDWDVDPARARTLRRRQRTAMAGRREEDVRIEFALPRARARRRSRHRRAGAPAPQIADGAPSRRAAGRVPRSRNRGARAGALACGAPRAGTAPAGKAAE